MNPCISCLLAICVLVSCNEDQNHDVSELNRENSVDTLEVQINDTISIGAYFLVFSETDSSYIPDFYENQNVKISGGQTAYFTKRKDTLTLLLNTGDSLMLIDDHEKVEQYSFIAHLPRINYYLIKVQYPEGNSYMIVNSNNGFKKYIPGLPFVSISGNKILAVNPDLVAGHTPNVLQLLTLNADSLVTNFTLHVKNWGPDKVKWTSDTSLILQKQHLVTDTANSRIYFTNSFSTLVIRNRKSY